jgi:hypothetical protein
MDVHCPLRVSLLCLSRNMGVGGGEVACGMDTGHVIQVSMW